MGRQARVHKVVHPARARPGRQPQRDKMRNCLLANAQRATAGVPACFIERPTHKAGQVYKQRQRRIARRRHASALAQLASCADAWLSAFCERSYYMIEETRRCV